MGKEDRRERVMDNEADADGWEEAYEGDTDEEYVTRLRDNMKTGYHSKYYQ